MNKQTGARIKKIRISQNIHAKHMADELGILDTSYSKIEREGTNNLKTLLKIASILKVELHTIIHTTNDINEIFEPDVLYGLATRQDIFELKDLITKVLNLITKNNQIANTKFKGSKRNRLN